MLATFDQPDMNPNCDLRRSSTVATQALWFMNDTEIVEHSERLAQLLFRSDTGDDARIHSAFIRLFAAPPTTVEMQWCREYLQSQTNELSDRSTGETNNAAAAQLSVEVRALATLCQTLLASNRFLYVD
jgi:hypothetical protein